MQTFEYIEAEILKRKHIDSTFQLYDFERYFHDVFGVKCNMPHMLLVAKISELCINKKFAFPRCVRRNRTELIKHLFNSWDLIKPHEMNILRICNLLAWEINTSILTDIIIKIPKENSTNRVAVLKLNNINNDVKTNDKDFYSIKSLLN